MQRAMFQIILIQVLTLQNVHSIPIRNCRLRVCVTDIELPKKNSLNSRKGGKVMIPEIQNISSEDPLIKMGNNAQDQDEPIALALKQPPTTMLPITSLTMPVDLAKAHYNHLRKVYGYKDVQSRRVNKKDESVNNWINTLIDPFRLVSKITQMPEKLKFWITLVGLSLTLAWNVVLLLTFIFVGAKLVWIGLKVVSASLEIVLACLKLPKTCIKAVRRRIRMMARQ